ncbi:MAG: isoleucine--tRNA ligase [Lentisphaeria bacterium]|nr:isoleucine--tRNA ligase [Lentisphaeria bacterium]
MFEAIEANVSFPKMEEETLAFWQQNGTFEKSLKQRKDAKPFVFYDGPPFATGLPHYGHLLAGTIKDVVPRYQTMCGKYVERTFGWDCHGLPIEALAQDKLKLSGTYAIMQAGVDVFNEKCRSMVLTYVNEWKQTVNRMGRWVDFENGYKTMNPTYMETIWWVFKQLWDQGRVYKAHRIMPYSWALTTPLSNFEANQNYKDVQDPTVTVRMKLTDAKFDIPADITPYICIWTTTPWTLPENLAVCVGPDVDYCLLKDGDTNDAYILAKARISAYYKKPEEYTVLLECKGRDLVGLHYEPIFPYFKDAPNAFRVLMDDYVTTTDGTGIVHQAPAYGEDDYRVCRAAGIDLIDPLDDEAKFTDAVPDFKGMNVKEADKLIIKHLKQIGKLVQQSTIVHSYPFCYRTETPLIYRAIDAWYVRVEDLHERLLKNNLQTTWMPEYVGDKRFANWLADAKDWNISRNRFWGSCLPVWINVDDPKDMICVGSIAELEQLSGVKVTDLHKHFIDKIEIHKDGKTYRRTPEVLDCWFESGSMPYAQHHYPFDNKEKVESTFPADFIAEGLDQTRGWFYSLLVLATCLFDKPAFKHVVVNGLVLAEDGRKMSKRLKNYPDPTEIIEKYGADALRLFLLASPAVRAEDLRFSENGVKEILRTVIIPLWNATSFFATYARIDNWKPEGDVAAPPKNITNILDKWILSKLMETIVDIRKSMDSFDLQGGATRFTSLIENLTNWYIRRSRRRFWKSDNDNDKNEAYQTLHYVIVTICQLAAPFIPFVTEKIYRAFRTESMPESVHLCDYPQVTEGLLDADLNKCMADTMCAVERGHFLRTQASIKVRQPLGKAVLVSANKQVRDNLGSMAKVIAEELNVKEISIMEDEEELVTLSAKPNLKKLGPKLGKRMKDFMPLINGLSCKDIGKLRKGETLTLTAADGTALELAEDDILVQRQEKQGLSVANEGDITVALDTQLTPALVQEGWAREIVSQLQSLRKETGLEVVDRITVRYKAPAEIAEALESQKAYIANEILAVSIDAAAENEQDFTEIKLNDQKAFFKIAKV